ncbi:mechanosensitive ion channel family protein [Croceicoccus naphthovorans]|uniref:mechanosensitive ion channel family protein n=1 Tax=Croceicoccus naphthovorans TaxID=1348774 RepID=UPI001C54C38D|nr:mechanosensitive ion channel domain-containing protein [Croceicoccus naphthovorans]
MLPLTSIASYTPSILLLLALLAGILILRGLAVRSIEDVSARYRVRKAIGYLGYILFFVVLLSMFSSRVAQFSVVIGAVGAGVAFALQEVIASVAGWVALSFGSFYKPGDRVQLGGIKGDVIDIGILRTTLMELGGWVNGDQYNGRIVRIANSYVFKQPVFNYSGEFPFLWDEFTIPVRYGSNWKVAQRMIEDAVSDQVEDFTHRSRDIWHNVARHFMIEQARVEPMVTLSATDNWIEFTVRYIVDYKARRSTKDAIMRKILEAVDRSGGKVQLASTTIELVNQIQKEA